MRPNKIGEEDQWYWPRVRKTRGCWYWTGTVHHSGYGVVKVEGKQTFAHRVALGIPDGIVLHRCGNRLCCRPSHLYKGDHKQNAEDRERHGRTASMPGESNPAAKLDQAAVDDIRSGGPARMFAEKYGITIRSVYKVRSGERWKDT